MFRAHRSAWLLAALMGACASVETTTDPDADFATYTTYAWSIAEEPPEGDRVAVHDEGVRLRVRDAVDRELAARGMRQVPEQDADLLVAQVLTVELRVQRNDPYYSLYVAEEYEEGALAIVLHDAKTKRLVWRGSIQDRLRYTSRAIGLHPTFVATGEQPVWRVDDMVGAVMAKLPRTR